MLRDARLLLPLLTMTACQPPATQGNVSAPSVGGLGGGAVAATPGAPTGAEAENPAAEQAIAAVEAAQVVAYNAHDGNRVLGFYAPDAVLVSAGKTLNGAAAIGAFLLDDVRDATYRVSFSPDRVYASGDLGFARGRVTGQRQDPRSKRMIHVAGHYVTIYRRQPDGSWKIAYDMNAEDS